MKNVFYLMVSMLLIAIACNSNSQNESLAYDGFNQKVADSVLHYLQEEKFDLVYNKFDNVISRQLNEEQLAVVWAQINGQFGKFVKTIDIRTEKSNYGETVVQKCEFEKANLNFTLTFGKGGRIVGIYFKPTN